MNKKQYKPENRMLTVGLIGMVHKYDYLGWLWVVPEPLSLIVLFISLWSLTHLTLKIM